MPDKKLTQGTTDVDYKGTLESLTKQYYDALDLIKHLQEDKEALINGQETLQKYIAEQKAENERLKDALTDHEYANCVAIKNGLIYTHTLEDYDRLIGNISAEAYKEFAERLKNEIISDTAYGCDTNQHTGYYDYQIKIGDIPEYIDNLLKEIIGE